MEAFPRDFPDWTSASVAAGEQSGKLEQVLTRLADYSERRQATRSTVVLTLVYPAFVAVIAVAVIAAMMVLAGVLITYMLYKHKIQSKPQ